MRVLISLGGDARPRGGGAVTAAPGPGLEAVAAGLPELASEHELIVAHGWGQRDGRALELALQNALPELEVLSVLTRVVVAADDPRLDERAPGRGNGALPSPEPRAIAAVRGLRALLDAGAVVVCAIDRAPIALDGMGALHEVEAVVDEDLGTALLARRLDADLLVMLTGARALRGTVGRTAAIGPKVEAACRFAEATGRRAAVGRFGDVVRIARGEAGTQVMARPPEPVAGAGPPRR